MHKFETRKHVGNVLPCLVLEMKSWKMNGPKATFKKVKEKSSGSWFMTILLLNFIVSFSKL